jgi:hypothetical protein
MKIMKIEKRGKGNKKERGQQNEGRLKRNEKKP